MADPGVGSLCASLIEALRPAAGVLGDARSLASVLHGVDPALDPDVQALAGRVGDLAAHAEAIAAAADAAALAAPDLGSPDPQVAGDAAGQMIGHAQAVVAHLLAAADVVADWDPAALGLPQRSAAQWEEALAGVLEALLVAHLEDALPALYGLLRALGIVEEDRAGVVALRLDRLGQLVGDPPGLLRDVTAWGTGALDVDWLTGSLTDSLGTIGLAARARPLRPRVAALLPAPQPAAAREVDVAAVGGFSPELGAFAELGIIVAAVSRAGGGEPDALLFTNLAWGAGEVSFSTPAGWQVGLDLGAQASASAGVLVSPAGRTRVGSPPAGHLEVSVARTATPPWRPLGSPTSTRLEVGGVRAGFRLTWDGDGDVALSGALDDAHLVLVAGSSFLAAVLGADAVDVDLSTELVWSGDGLTVAGGPGLAVVLPLHLLVGPVELRQLRVAIGAVPADGGGPEGGVRLEARLDLTAALGPFTVSVDGLGVAVAIGPAQGAAVAVGPVGLDVAVLAPQGIGLALDAPGVSAEGLLHVDGDRYVGGLSAQVLAVGVDILVVVDTSLPGDPDGFGLLASLGLRFPAVPLGFGFSLSGLGGLLALNRRVDAEALALGLRDGAVDAILFPDDLVRDIDVLVGQVDTYFPIAPGSTVVGPVAEISWGVPIIIRGQLGVVISLPDGVVVVLGSIRLALPDEDAPVLELHLDALGALDLPGGTLLVVASLYDSRLLGVIELSGDAALYASWLTDPYFLLSVGGFHPGFQPPCHVPSVLESLRRMRASIPLGLGVSASFEAYAAVTSNSVQFGGRVEIEASATFLLVTYTAVGFFELDVLLRFAPFALVADASAGVGVYAGSKELMGVQLDVHLEGPQPWYASGYARFTFFGVRVTFDVTVGGHAPPQVRGSADVLVEVATALASPAAWTREPAAGIAAGLALTGGESLVRPDDTVVARQSQAPLDRPIARFGELTPLQSFVRVTGAVLMGPDGTSVPGLEVEDALDWFAPAMFDVLPDTARLSAPSYEQMTAGVRLGTAAVTVPRAEAAEGMAGHETEVWEPDRGSVGLGVVPVERDLASLVAGSAAGRLASWVRGPSVAVAGVRVDRQRYVVVDPTAGTRLRSPRSFGAAVDAAASSGVAAARVVPVEATVPR